jgi:coenzyme F420-reducing hydrogenase gamma subunit
MHGIFKSPRATEKFVAVIAVDNKSLYEADEDGFLEGQISNNDTINIIYRHSTTADTVVAVGTWTRKK